MRQLIGPKVQRLRVEAVALARWRRAVVEGVPKMAMAAGAADLGAGHAPTLVHMLFQVFFGGGTEEARPAGSRFELGRGVEEWQPAAGAQVPSGFVGGVEASTKRSLGLAGAQHPILLRG